MEQAQKSLLSKSCELLGWQGGTIHQVLDAMCAMDNKGVNRILSILKYYVLNNNIQDGFHTLLNLYLVPIAERTGYEIKLRKPATK